MRLKDVDVIMEFISSSLNEMTKLGISVDGEYLWELFNTAIDETPTVDAEPIRHGHWIGVEFDKEEGSEPVYDFFMCSECEGQTMTPYYNYCPFCGTKMDEVEE